MTGIVGAGLTGLALSNALQDRGIDHIVFEAESRPGGVVRSIRKDGAVLETGPQRMRLVESVARLVDRLGLRDDLVLAPDDLPLLILAGGKLHAMPRGLAELARSRLLPARAKLRIFAEPFAPPPRTDESAGAYLRRRFGKHTYERLLAPLFGGLYASDPDTMLARHALATLLRDLGIERTVLPVLFRASLRRSSADSGPTGRGSSDGVPQACSFRNGLGTFVDALHRRVIERVRLGVPVRAIAPQGSGWMLRTAGGEHAVDNVVLTCPADHAAELLEGCAPGSAAALRGLTYNPIALVHMRADLDLRAAGYQVAPTEPLRTRGVTFNHTLFGRDELYTAFLGGQRDRHIANEPGDTIAAHAVTEFEAVTGAPARAVHVSRTRIPAWDATWTALDSLRLPDGIHICANYESRVGISGRIAAAERLASALS